MDRPDRAPVGIFHAPVAWEGSLVQLGEGAAHHAQVKRLAVGDVVRLTDGAGRRATGVVATLGKKSLSVHLESEDELSPRPPEIELWSPVGDRDRMLWLAEKCTELGLSSWRSVAYRRSRSVSPRGEGSQFLEKLRARMVSALEQSGGAWLPALRGESELEEALCDVRGGGILLDASGPPLGPIAMKATLPLVVALGPEGGLEAAERARFLDAGWRPASLGDNVLRFETAGVAALAVLRSHLGWGEG